MKPNFMLDNLSMMSRKKTILAITGTVFLVILITIIIIVASVTKNKLTPMILELSARDLIEHWEKSKLWKIYPYDYGKDQLTYDEDNDAIKAIYPAGTWAPSGEQTAGLGGFNFKARPPFFPANEICLKYQIKFDASFNWMKGGKLPGLWIGDLGASGGNHDVNGYSYRFAWRSKGSCEAYLYVPDGQNDQYINQSGYVHNEIYGDSLWRGLCNFQQEEWYTIALYIKLNTFTKNHPNRDGVIQLTVNNATQRFEEIIWTTDPVHHINGILMDSFFGGSDASWATPVTTYISFRKFMIAHSVCN